MKTEKTSIPVKNSIPLVAVSRTNSMPVSSGQERLWYLSQVQEPAYSYNEQMEVRIDGSLDISFLKHSLKTIVERHEALRTVFVQVENGDLRQTIVKPFSVDVPMMLVGEEGMSDVMIEKEVFRVALEQGQAPYDLIAGPLFRVCVLQLPQNKQILIFSYHHIILDGRALAILLNEINILYDAKIKGLVPVLERLPVQCADYACWEQQWVNTEKFSKRLEYWKKQLHGLPSALDLPVDYPRLVSKKNYGAWEYIKLPKNLTKKILALSWQEKIAPYVVILTAYKILLMRYTGQDDIVTGTIIANRGHPEIKELLGFFAETMILRSDLSNGETFRQLLHKLNALSHEVFHKQTVGFGKLVEVLRVTGTLPPEASPVQAALVFNSIPFHEDMLAGRKISCPSTRPMGASKFDMTLSLNVVDDSLKGYLEYNTDLFKPETIKCFLRHYHLLLESIAVDLDQNIATIPLLTKKERRQILINWNACQESYPIDQCIHQLFEAQVDKTPQAVAVAYEDQQLTYDELNKKSNQLAHYLMDRGVGPEVRVGLCLERSLEMIVGILGILKAGGAYVPIDPNYPQQRIDYLVKDSGIELLLTQIDLVVRIFDDQTLTCLCLDRDWPVIAQSDTKNPEVSVEPANLTYVIYTSGSTGKPKGSLITHANVVRLFSATQEQYQFNQHDVWTLFHSFSFDFSVWELWGALCYGGKVIVIPYWISREPERFCELVYEQGVTVLNQTPSAFIQFIAADRALNFDSNMLKLRYVVFGGEALDMKSLQPWFERHGDRQPRLINMYGITETTVHVTYCPVGKADTERSSSVIGKQLADLQSYILDEHLQLMPIGIPGELHVGGGGVARGYHNRSDLTAERFIPNPFSEVPGACLYKTGDLVRYLPDGTMEYLGRIDKQVKIRGFRIELGEIQHALTEQSVVKEAVVLAQAFQDEARGHCLVAYIVLNEEMEPELKELRNSLKSTLPDYMVPSFFILLNQMPLTENGKVDYKALPAPDQKSLVTHEYIAPHTEVEQELVNIWEDILGLSVDKVGIQDNFLDLGGHSLLASKAVSRINKKFNITIKISDLSSANRLQALAVTIEEHISNLQLIKGLTNKTANSNAEREEFRI